jgi:hypothetical protein
MHRELAAGGTAWRFATAMGRQSSSLRSGVFSGRHCMGPCANHGLQSTAPWTALGHYKFQMHLALLQYLTNASGTLTNQAKLSDR